MVMRACECARPLKKISLSDLFGDLFVYWKLKNQFFIEKILYLRGMIYTTMKNRCVTYCTELFHVIIGNYKPNN